MKDVSISVRLDSQLKEQTENILYQLGLNMATAINMLFRQIVREQALPLSLKLKTQNSALDDIIAAENERLLGYKGRPIDDVIADMEKIIAEAENAENKI